MFVMQVSELYIYPVKSMAGISLESSQVDAMGLQYDRRWMVVTPDGRFVTQRSHPQMALIQPRFENQQLILSSFGLDDHSIPETDKNGKTIRVTLWGDRVTALHVSKATDEWLEHTIGEPCHLVFIPDDEIRQCDLKYAEQGDRTGFADGFPLLIISQASLDDLNTRLDTPVDMRYFRPNIVVSETEAYAEDTWQSIQIQDISFRIVKPCSRCVITTVDPNIGIANRKDNLQVLASYRQRGSKIFFGQNVIHDGQGRINTGNKLTILKQGESNVPTL